MLVIEKEKVQEEKDKFEQRSVKLKAKLKSFESLQRSQNVEMKKLEDQDESKYDEFIQEVELTKEQLKSKFDNKLASFAYEYKRKSDTLKERERKIEKEKRIMNKKLKKSYEGINQDNAILKVILATLSMIIVMMIFKIAQIY